jgi:hypothetical protein
MDAHIRREARRLTIPTDFQIERQGHTHFDEKSRTSQSCSAEVGPSLFPVASASRRPKETNGEAEAEDAAVHQTERPG